MRRLPHAGRRRHRGFVPQIGDTEYKDGPNFNQRKEQYEDVLYAIQNGGFSSGPMPQNIVVGEDAKMVACFLATVSGKDADQEPRPGGATRRTPVPATAARARHRVRRRVLDLKAIRATRRPCWPRWPAAVTDPTSACAPCWSSTSAAGAAPRGRGAAGRRTRPVARSSRPARTREGSPDRVSAAGRAAGAIEKEFEAALATVPNPPDPTAADADEVLREVGEAGAEGPDHLEVAGGLVDMEAGARVSGSRFAYLKGDVVLV